MKKKRRNRLREQLVATREARDLFGKHLSDAEELLRRYLRGRYKITSVQRRALTEVLAKLHIPSIYESMDKLIREHYSGPILKNLTVPSLVFERLKKGGKS
ncbi:MAG: hypothetical protein WAN65_16070 [Candidatus Sulfotelmatobacter sp.]